MKLHIGIIDAVANSIQIISLAAILIFIEPFIAIIFILLGLPYLLAHWKIAKLRYNTEHARTSRRRWTGYYLSQVLDRGAVPETRLLDLAPLFIQKFRSLMDGFRDQNQQIYKKGLGVRTLLDNLSLTINAGESLALVGENGAGKSTLVKLITRLYDPDSGSILMNGTDIREFPLTQLHRNISFVFQNFRRVEAKASDNIAFGNWEVLLDDHGQVEELAIARALAKPASLLILDEPSSSLDARAEYELFSRFRS